GWPVRPPVLYGPRPRHSAATPVYLAPSTPGCGCRGSGGIMCGLGVSRCHRTMQKPWLRAFSSLPRSMAASRLMKGTNEVEITDAGEAMFHRLLNAAVAFDHQLRSGLTARQAQALTRALRRLRANAQGHTLLLCLFFRLKV